MKIIVYFLYIIAMVATIYYNGMNNSIAKIIAMVTFGVLFVIALYRRMITKIRPKIFSRWTLWFILACLVNLLLAIDKMSVDQLFNMEIAMPLVVAFSSFYLLDIKREKLSQYMLPICLFAAYCSISSVLSGLGEFRVAEYGDIDVAKNQIGATFTSFAIISAVFALENKRIVIKASYVILSIVCMYPALFFSCRTALLSYMIVVVFLVFRAFGWKGVIIIPIAIVVVAFLGGDDVRNLLYNSIVGNKDVEDLDDLSSGRLTNAALSIDYFLKHPFIGFYGSGEGFEKMPPNAHVYILYRLTKWGIIGAIPFIALYWTIFKTFIISVRSKELLLSGLLLLAFIESFSEYSPPFGPGSCFTVTFVLIGYYFRQRNRINKIIIHDRNLLKKKSNN